jgi:DNA-binding CsgD family transcriptional regulator
VSQAVPRELPVQEKTKRDLIRLAYASATDPAQLPVLLEEYSKAVGAQGSGLVVQDLKNQRGSVSESWGFDPAWERKYAEHYAQTNVWIQRMGPMLRPGRVLSSEGVIDDGELVRTEFYNDFLRPQGIFHSFGAAVTREDDVSAYITSVRSQPAGHFRAHEHEVCRELMPHLQSALRIRHQFAGLETQLKQMSAVLDGLPQGIVMVNARGRVLFVNRGAERLLKPQNGLWIGGEGLRALRAEETARLRELLNKAAQTVAGNGEHPGGAMRISRLGGPPLRISVAPLDAGANGSPVHAAAMVTIAVPPERDAPIDAALLQEWFGFTRAEARLTAALASGKSVQEFSEEVGVSLNTARTHLKSAFAKAGVKRQAALVREILTALEQLRRNW